MKSNKENDFVCDTNNIFDFSIYSILGDRLEQQDNFGYLLKENEGMIVVCDGMGGHKDGGLASKTAVDAVIDMYASESLDDCTIDNLQKLSIEANRKVKDLSNESESLSGAGSTMVLIYIRNNKLYWNSVGDSRAYLIRNNAYVQITQDHSYKTVLDGKLNAGSINLEEYELEINKGDSLICFLGMDDLSLIDYNDNAIDLLPNDKIVIMTDGLYKILDDAEIFNVVINFSNISDAMRAVENRAKLAAKKYRKRRDNTTVCEIKIK